MWILLNDYFFSIVDKDCARDELLVRARRKGDIEKLWPEAKVRRDGGSDYLYRARIKRDDVKAALAKEVDRVGYGNFKDSVADDRLHAAIPGAGRRSPTCSPAASWGCRCSRGKGMALRDRCV